LLVRTVLAAAALVLVSASCGGGGGAEESNTPEPTQSATTTAAPAGEHFGYIRSVSAAGPTTTLAFDEAEFLKGKEAQQAAEEDGVVESAGLDSDLPPAVGVPGDPSPVRATPAFRPLQEPWYLVWSEAVATQRRVQVLLLLVVAAVAAFFFFARGGTSGASLGAILRHPENYEGRSVVVRGEVLEIFDVGTGHAFQIRQGRDMVVVYSTLREPRLHDRVEVSGIVSTGYLDGKPRIDRKVLAAKAEELDRTIRELTAMRDGLRHAVACRAPSHMECPTFQRLLRAAAAGTIGARKKKALS